jgi:hypothetical protein
MDDMNYYVELLTDRLERLEKVISTENVEALYEMSFLENSAFDCVKKCLDASESHTSHLIDVNSRIEAVIHSIESRLVELEAKLKALSQTSRTLRKYNSNSNSDGLISKCI